MGDQVLAKSTAHWKVIFGHHRPRGMYGFHIEPMLEKYGVQLVIGAHTHEVGFHARYLMGGDNPKNTKAALIMHGMGGGAIGNPGCGAMDFCGKSQDYGFIDTQWTKYSLKSTFYHFDGKVMYEATINSLGDDGGEWVIGNWTMCGASKKQTRSVICSEGADSKCPYMAKPALEQACTSTETHAPTAAPAGDGDGDGDGKGDGDGAGDGDGKGDGDGAGKGDGDGDGKGDGDGDGDGPGVPTPAPAPAQAGGSTTTMVVGGLAVVAAIAGAGILFVKFGGGGQPRRLSGGVHGQHHAGEQELPTAMTS